MAFLRAGLPSAYSTKQHRTSTNYYIELEITTAISVTMRSALPVFVAFLAAAVTSTIAAPMPGDSLQDLGVRISCPLCSDVEADCAFLL